MSAAAVLMERKRLGGIRDKIARQRAARKSAPPVHASTPIPREPLR